MKTPHTLEPWEVDKHFKHQILSPTIGLIANCFDYAAPYEHGESNAARIVACVNNCVGATNEELEAEPYKQLKAQRDELLAALKAAKEIMTWAMKGTEITKEDIKDITTAIANAEKNALTPTDNV